MTKRVTQQQFDELGRQGFNRVPVVREILADLDTPLSTYLKLADGPYSYLFESVQGGEKWGRYSILGLPCRTVIKICGMQVQTFQEGNLVSSVQVDDPLAWVADYHGQFKEPELGGLPRFTGGLVGYFSYDTVRYVEKKLASCKQADPLQLPDICLMVSDEVLVFDNLAGKLYLIVQANPQEDGAWDRAQARLQWLGDAIRNAASVYPSSSQSSVVSEADFKSGLTQVGYEQAVHRIKDYIRDGDVMQVVLAQRMSIPFNARPLDLYRALRCTNPSPYMFYLNLDDCYVVGSSPEILARFDQGEVTVRPIAGTRPRGKSVEEDVALEQELLRDPKEIAEHLMLIDLGRNDVGRISEIGSVRVTEKMTVERYSHVMHIVSNVVGKVRAGLSGLDVLRATLPAGTLSGAPKVRAMEIIDELEPVKRGIYGGAVGYWAWSGSMDTAIAIRTAVIKHGQLYVQAGAGVVADSNPTSEWQETLNKGRAIFNAVAMAEKGLDQVG
jgi:anthranilate synthase component I